MLTFSGRIKKTELCPVNQLMVTVQCEVAKCRDPLVLVVPASVASQWLPGTAVEITLKQLS